MRTSCYSNLSKIDRSQFGPVGITRGIPKWLTGRNRPPNYSDLAPTWPMLKMPLDEYEPTYQQILAKLDPQRVWDELHHLALDREPVLLCYENPTKGPLDSPENFCHRRMAAGWIENHLGVSVPELTFGGPSRPSPGSLLTLF